MSKADGKSGYVRSNRPRAISALAGRLSRRAFGVRGLADGAIVNEWPTIVGPDISRYCVPERITHRRLSDEDESTRGGTLHLKVAGGGFAMEIQHLEPQLIERINAHFGYRAVARLRIVQGPLPVAKSTPAGPRALDGKEEAALKERLATVSDPELKAALEGLGRSIMARHRNDDPGPTKK